MKSERSCLGAIRQPFEATLQRLVELGYECGKQTPWPKPVRACRLNYQ